MIVKSPGGGYQVKSEHKTGKGGKRKNLSKPGLSKAAALARLRAVEYFKHRHGG